MKKTLLTIIAIFSFSVFVDAQNNLPTIAAPIKKVVSFGGQSCIDATTSDNDNDTVILWWDNAVTGTFSTNNNQKLFASASVCITATRGIHAVGNNFFTLFATDGKDTISVIYNFEVRDYPYKVHPKYFNKLNTFMVDVMGDASEPWGNYIGLTFESKIYDLDMKLVYRDTNRFFAFTPKVAGKYLLLTTYKTSAPDIYTSRDTLETDYGMGVETLDVNSLNIYPNPASTIVHIQNLPADATMFEITDITGRIVGSLPVNQDSFDVSQLAPNIYIITAYSDTKMPLLRAKLIKE